VIFLIRIINLLIGWLLTANDDLGRLESSTIG